MSEFSGKLGAGFCQSEKPVVLLDDFKGSFQEFDTVHAAFVAKEEESKLDQWAALKMVIQFNFSKMEYEIQTAPDSPDSPDKSN